MAVVVYMACALLSFACAFLLYRGYQANHVRLLFWTSLCFLGLALSNIVLFVDQLVLPNVDLTVARLVPAFVGMVTLLYGLISETV